MTEINATGSALVYSTYLGGNGIGFGYGIAVDSSGSTYVTGSTDANNFPLTPGAFQTVYGGNYDVFVTKFNPTGSALVYSTYLGRSAYQVASGISVDSAGNAYVTGETYSVDFPTTPGAFQTTCSGCGINSPDAFVTKINSTGSALVYSTYLGGSGFDSGSGIAVDSSGYAHVTGWTSSTNFPVTPGAFQTVFRKKGDAFVTKINATGSALVYSTYLGGNGGSSGSGIAVDGDGDTYVSGSTSSIHFPTTPDAFQTACGGIPKKCAKYGDAFVTKMYMPAATTATLTSSPNPSQYGQTLTLTAVVVSGIGAPPDGENISFMKGKTVLGTGTLNSGSATLTISTLKAGTNSIKAVYGGDSNFAGSTSNPVKQVVNKAGE